MFPFDIDDAELDVEVEEDKEPSDYEIDFETGIITNHTTGKTIHSESVGDYMMNILKSGGIKPMIRAQL